MIQVNSRLSRLWRVVENALVQDVPDEIALCEFDCRKARCTHEEWDSCHRRLGRAAGELSPLSTERHADWLS